MKCKRKPSSGQVEDRMRSATAEHGATTMHGLFNGCQHLCDGDPCEMIVRAVLVDSTGQKELWLRCLHCNGLFAYPWIEWQGESGRLLEVVDEARRGNEAAKMILLEILETERKPTILYKLRIGDLRDADLRDGHHDVSLKLYEKIESLRVTRAYYKYESRVISDVCKKWRRNYRAFGVPLEAVLPEMERKKRTEETFHDYQSALHDQNTSR